MGVFWGGCPWGFWGSHRLMLPQACLGEREGLRQRLAEAEEARGASERERQRAQVRPPTPFTPQPIGAYRAPGNLWGVLGAGVTPPIPRAGSLSSRPRWGTPSGSGSCRRTRGGHCDRYPQNHPLSLRSTPWEPQPRPPPPIPSPNFPWSLGIPWAPSEPSQILLSTPQTVCALPGAAGRARRAAHPGEEGQCRGERGHSGDSLGLGAQGVSLTPRLCA